MSGRGRGRGRGPGQGNASHEQLIDRQPPEHTERYRDQGLIPIRAHPALRDRAIRASNDLHVACSEEEFERLNYGRWELVQDLKYVYAYQPDTLARLAALGDIDLRLFYDRDALWKRAYKKRQEAEKEKDRQASELIECQLDGRIWRDQCLTEQEEKDRLASELAECQDDARHWRDLWIAEKNKKYAAEQKANRVTAEVARLKAEQQALQRENFQQARRIKYLEKEVQTHQASLAEPSNDAQETLPTQQDPSGRRSELAGNPNIHQGGVSVEQPSAVADEAGEMDEMAPAQELTRLLTLKDSKYAVLEAPSGNLLPAHGPQDPSSAQNQYSGTHGSGTGVESNANRQSSRAARQYARRMQDEYNQRR